MVAALPEPEAEPGPDPEPEPEPEPAPARGRRRERVAASYGLAEPLVLWQLALALAAEGALLLAAAVAAGQRGGLHALLLGLLLAVTMLRRDRWAAIRRARWRWVRQQYQAVAIYHFAWRLDRACAQLPPPADALEALPGGSDLLDEILADGPNTYQ